MTVQSLSFSRRENREVGGRKLHVFFVDFYGGQAAHSMVRRWLNPAWAGLKSAQYRVPMGKIVPCSFADAM
ncbi:hypothetical protein GCM10026915_22180 [Simiduia litorea]